MRFYRAYLRTVGVLCLAVLPVMAAADSISRRSITLTFQAMVGDSPFECGQSYRSIGVGGSTFTPSEFRMFIHNVRMVRSDGAEVPLELEQDGLWQNGDLAMLDFENGSGPCGNGTSETRTIITGSVPDAEYLGVRFVIGVPFERNHSDLAMQPSPLSVTRMFWSWNAGHKFIRLDGRTETGKNWVLHLGSTGCTPTGRAARPATNCEQSNLVPVELKSFNHISDVIVADVAALYAESNLEANQERTAAGCMSSPADSDCGPIFAALGIPFNDAPIPVQRFLRVQSGGARADRLP